MFTWIANNLLKALLIIVGGIVAICVCNGCVPEKASLTSKEITENHDDSVNISGDGAYSVDPVDVINAKAEERVSLVRAQEEKWRLAVWIFGIGAVVVGVLALLIRSPLDGKKVT